MTLRWKDEKRGSRPVVVEVGMLVLDTVVVIVQITASMTSQMGPVDN